MATVDLKRLLEISGTRARLYGRQAFPRRGSQLTHPTRARPLPADAGLALYRGAQEALTNIARYAPGAAATVVLRYGTGRTTLTIEDRLAGPKPDATGLGGVGGGNGLAGMRERLERAGGTMQAGPTDTGWRVELEVPT